MNKYTSNLMDLEKLINKMYTYEDEINKAALLMFKTICYGGNIYVIGNGGSAADANHFTGEILGRFKRERKGLGAISLTADNATITAIANDYGYEWVFQRQLEGVFKPKKDLLFTMSTSGNSKNIINAIEYVYEMNGYVVNLLGKDGGEVAKYNNGINIIVPSLDTDRIQEIHKFILHYIAEVIEDRYLQMKGR